MCALSEAALEGQVQRFQCWCSLPLKKQCDRFRYGKHGHTLTVIFEKKWNNHNQRKNNNV